ncbi:hypothetical protein P3S67_014045 [Capsicum chacoense]
MLPIIWLMSAGQKSDHSCAISTMRHVFKSTEAENGGTSSSNTLSKPREQSGPSCSAVATNMEEEALTSDPHAITHNEGRCSDPAFGYQLSTQDCQPQPARRIPSSFGENFVNKPLLEHTVRKGKPGDIWQSNPVADAEIASTGSVNGVLSEVQSSSSPIRILEMENGYSSEGEITMYSAETAESRNFPSPTEGRYQQVGRSQSCVN